MHSDGEPFRPDRVLTIDEVSRRYAQEAERWAEAGSDPDFLDEVGELEAAYGSADLETWPR